MRLSLGRNIRTHNLHKPCLLTSSSKAEYQSRLTNWGFKKKTNRKSWQIIRGKVDKRDRHGKKLTNIYRDGVLVPHRKAQREISRQGFMSTFELLQIAKGMFQNILDVSVANSFNRPISLYSRRFRDPYALHGQCSPPRVWGSTYLTVPRDTISSLWYVTWCVAIQALL